MPEPLKNLFFIPVFHDDLAVAVQAVHPEFDSEAFVASIYDSTWQQRELKDRMRHTTLMLHRGLPADYRTALAILRQVVEDLEIYGFEKMIFPDYVELYGLDDWEASLPALEHFTQHMSAEFAVRPFIIQDQARMLAQMLEWAQHEHEQVRRLATEGCRPRLPWAMALPALKADPRPILPILEQLRFDASETVRRSVANNLNDIAKDNPRVVLDVVSRWREEADDNLNWIIQHALRTLLKAGNADALALLGFAQPAVQVHGLTVEPATLAVGDDIEFAFEVRSTAQAPQDLMIDYVLHFKRSNGKTSAKVFKLAKRALAPGEMARLAKKHSFRPISTRRYYPGEHALEVQVNGQRLARQTFWLEDA